MMVVYLVAAWFSEGFSHFDEHYQILEFAAYHIHHYPFVYPWELDAQIRPTLQIWVVILLYKMGAWLSWQLSPFMIAFLTRALTGLLSAVSCYVFVNAFKDELNSPNKKYCFFLFSAFGYMAVYSGVRFSSETVSAIFFLLGFSLLFSKTLKKTHAIYFVMGLFLGLAFITRYQTGLMIAGLIAWLVIFRALTLSELSVLVMSILLVCGFGVYIDSLFYGKLTYTAWHYFNVNILQDKVSDFGKRGCWEYLKVAFYPPYGGLYAVSCLYFIINCRKHVMTWVMVPFILVHCLIGHKEMRFLLPILGLMPFVLLYTIQLLQNKYPARFNGPRLLALNKPAWILNGIFGVVAVFVMHFDLRIYKYMWTHYQHTAVFLNMYVKDKDLYADNAVVPPMPLRFYAPESFYVHIDNRRDKLRCQQDATCLTWMPCYENVIKDNPNMRLVYDSCLISDTMRVRLNVAHWMEKSVLFRMNGRIYVMR